MISKTKTTNTNEDGSLQYSIPYKYVSRKLIHKAKLTLDFASKCLTLDETGITAIKKLNELSNLKQCCRDYFRKEIEALMLNESQSQGIYCHDKSYKVNGKRLVKTMSGLRGAIKQNYSNAFFKNCFK